MEKFITHITNDGDRWDNLAYRYYGNPYAYGAIVEANPAEFMRLPILPSGIVLKIPVVETSRVQPQNLPPWKR